MFKTLFLILIIFQTISCQQKPRMDERISICQTPYDIKGYRNINISDYHYVEASIKEIEKLDIEYFMEGQSYCQLLKLKKKQYCVFFFHSIPSPGGDLEICHNIGDNSIIDYKLGE